MAPRITLVAELLDAFAAAAAAAEVAAAAAAAAAAALEAVLIASRSVGSPVTTQGLVVLWGNVGKPRRKLRIIWGCFTTHENGDFVFFLGLPH